MKKLFLSFLGLALMLSLNATAQFNRANAKNSVPYRANYQRAAAGSSGAHNFEIREGTLWAWGQNTNGQLGDGSTTDRKNRVQIGADSNWVTISAGGSHTLGLKADGTLWAWGYNFAGEVGDGTTTQRNSPVQIGAGTTWISVSAGNLHSLGLKSDGTLWTWGMNANGQLGDGNIIDRTVPVQIGTDNKWTNIAAAGDHSLALKADGTLWAWGSNTFGQLGDASTSDKNSPVQIGSDRDWMIIRGGHEHSLALKYNGTLWAWGKNDSSQLGDQSTTNRTSPLQIGIDNKWVSVAAGKRNSLGVKADGTLWAWGDNQYGQLGDGTTTNRNNPRQIGTENKWVSISGGSYTSLAIKSDGSLWAWGANFAGQTGDGTLINRNNPVQSSIADNKWLSLIANGHQSIGIRSNGTLWAWGDNLWGQLGIGTTFSQYTPTRAGSDNKWISVSEGQSHSLGLKSDGTIWGWGSNGAGQVGDGTVIDRHSAVQIGTANNWVSIAAGGHSSYGIKSDGTLWSWGWNMWGQLGLGDTSNRKIPVQIGTATNWASISCMFHVMALRSNGTLWTWGYNWSGQLGDGTVIQKNSPQQIGSDSDWTGTSSGDDFSQAWKSNGTIWAWGYNGHGALGNGTQLGWKTPLQIGSDNNWISIKTGRYHTAGLKSDGTLWTWGGNAEGALGDGTNILRSSPVKIGTGKSWISVSTAYYHIIGMKADRKEFCGSGKNNYGQLGDKTYTNKNTFGCINPCFTPIAPVASNQTICSGSSVLLSATGIGSLAWFSAAIGGTRLASGANYNTPVLTANTTYYVQDSTCSVSPGRTAVIVTVNQLPVVSANASATSVCKGSGVTLTGGGALSYIWTGGVSNGISFVPLSSNTYMVTGTDSNNCKNTAQVLITVNLPPVVNAFASADSVCSGTPVTLTGGGASIYSWTGGVTNGIPFAASVTSTYFVTGIDINNCSDTDSVTLNVIPSPDVTLTTNGTNITATQNGATYQWLDCNTGFSPIPAAINQSFTATSNGEFAVSVTMAGCSDTSACVNISNVGINENIKGDVHLSIYPNPASGQFTIQSSTEGSYNIINLLGQTVGSFELNAANNNSAKIDNLDNGVYFIVGLNNNQLNMQKVVVAK